MELEKFKTKRTDIISRMLDNPDEIGIYPTAKCFEELDQLFEENLREISNLKKEKEALFDAVGKLSDQLGTVEHEKYNLKLKCDELQTSLSCSERFRIEDAATSNEDRIIYVNKIKELVSQLKQSQQINERLVEGIDWSMVYAKEALDMANNKFPSLPFDISHKIFNWYKEQVEDRYKELISSFKVKEG